MHYVYYLFSQTEELVYIGRSLNPKGRQRTFNKRTGLTTTLGVCQRFSDFEQACIAELKAISEHWPPYNKAFHSRRGRLGKSMSCAQKDQVSKQHAGKVLSESHKQALKLSHVGRTLTQEHKLIISKTHKGKKLTEAHKETLRLLSTCRVFSNEHKAKLSAAQKDRQARARGVA